MQCPDELSMLISGEIVGRLGDLDFTRSSPAQVDQHGLRPEAAAENVCRRFTWVTDLEHRGKGERRDSAIGRRGRCR